MKYVDMGKKELLLEIEEQIEVLKLLQEEYNEIVDLLVDLQLDEDKQIYETLDKLDMLLANYKEEKELLEYLSEVMEEKRRR